MAVAGGRRSPAAGRQLQDERRSRGQPVELIDCLQITDKGQVIIEDPRELSEMGFKSNGEASRAIRELESLRNNLAHAQSIST